MSNLNKVQGTELAVCEDIARRQQFGLNKYGTTVRENPLTLVQWLQHAYEETLDKAVYLKRAIEEMEEKLGPVLNELDRAKRMFPNWPSDPIHALAIVGEELGEVQKEVLQLVYEPHKASREKMIEEAVQMAAMAFRFLEHAQQYDFNAAKEKGGSEG